MDSFLNLLSDVASTGCGSEEAMEFTITRDHKGICGFTRAGLVVTNVEAGGPAYRAGVRQCQTITHVDSVEATANNIKELLATSKAPDRSFTIRVKDMHTFPGAPQ